MHIVSCRYMNTECGNCASYDTHQSSFPFTIFTELLMLHLHLCDRQFLLLVNVNSTDPQINGHHISDSKVFDFEASFK